MASNPAAKEKPARNRPSSLVALWATLVATCTEAWQDAKTQARSMLAGLGLQHFAQEQTAATSTIASIVEFLAAFLLLIIVLVIAFLLLPLVNDSSNTISTSANTTSSQKSLLPIVGLLLVVALIVLILGFVIASFKNVVDHFR